MARYLIGLGSNQGDRLDELVQARSWLSLSGKVAASSALYTTEPVGPGSNDYFNAVIAIETTLAPTAVLSVAKRWERDRGRLLPVKRWTDRPVDIDIIACEALVFEHDTLRIPHPEMKHRRFVLQPLADIEPGWKHPLSGETVSNLLAQAPEIRMVLTVRKW